MLELFSRIDQMLARGYDAIGTLAGITIGLFALAIPVDLVMRLVGVGNLPGMQEIIEYLLFIAVFMTAPWVLRLGAHIRVDVVVGALPKRTAQWVERALDLLGLAICLVIIYFGIAGMIEAYVTDSAQRKTYVVYEWFLLLFLNLSFLLMAVEFLFRMIRVGAAPGTKAAGTEQAGL